MSRARRDARHPLRRALRPVSRRRRTGAPYAAGWFGQGRLLARYGSSSPTPLTYTRPRMSQHETMSPPTATTRSMTSPAASPDVVLTPSGTRITTILQGLGVSSTHDAIGRRQDSCAKHSNDSGEAGAVKGRACDPAKEKPPGWKLVCSDSYQWLTANSRWGARLAGHGLELNVCDGTRRLR
jgi:hypothetical protein